MKSLLDGNRQRLLLVTRIRQQRPLGMDPLLYLKNAAIANELSKFDDFIVSLSPLSVHGDSSSGAD